MNKLNCFEQHCCFNTSDISYKSVRIHVPLASKCSMGCVYCDYVTDQNITFYKGRPGTAEKSLTTSEDIKKYLNDKFSRYPECQIIGVSGPGEPFENLTGLFTLADMIRKRYPDNKLCICTNGSRFEEFELFIKHCESFRYLTITINSLLPATVCQLYRSVKDKKSAEKLIESQLNIVRLAKQYNLLLKINTLITDISSTDEIVKLLEVFRDMGVDCFNILKQEPVSKGTGSFQNQLQNKYLNCMEILKKNKFALTSQCRKCQSDSCGY